MVVGPCGDGEHTLRAVPAKTATYAAAGNIAYWKCETCGKYFRDADGKEEITQADTVIPKLTPKAA
ncbi:MAG: hypothetical protein IJ109_03330 [Firmicutes bacterium]|nr:hypothetical protein [Bacillota bacterium]